MPYQRRKKTGRENEDRSSLAQRLAAIHAGRKKT
jgi:hypothetical protein